VVSLRLSKTRLLVFPRILGSRALLKHATEQLCVTLLFGATAVTVANTVAIAAIAEVKSRRAT
jgi:hypothetical protein